MTIKGGQQICQIGSKNHNSKLNEQDVEIIRFRMQKKRDELAAIDLQIELLKEKRAMIVKYDSINQMALDFEISKSSIRNVLYRTDIWGHVK